MSDESFQAWCRLILFGEPSPKEIARLLRTREPVPEFVQGWLADLLDPPDEGHDGKRLVLERDGRAAQKFETRIKAFQFALKLQTFLDCNVPLATAIGILMPGQERRAYELWHLAQPFIEWVKSHPGQFELIQELYRDV